MRQNDLDSVTPSTAIEMYLNEIEGTVSPNTHAGYQYKLEFFKHWCQGWTVPRTVANNGGGFDENDPRIETMDQLTGKHLTQFRNWRNEDINTVTLRTNLSTLKQFLQFCVRIDAVDPSLPEKLNVPTLRHGENERTDHLAAEFAQDILDWYDTFEYASLDHVIFLLQWHMGVRMGTLHSLDVDDVDFEQSQITVEHRPDTDTRLKNGYDGERVVAIDEGVADVLYDYLEYRHVPVTDDYGRNPLFGSKHGRLSKSVMNKRQYKSTTPCQVGLECPAGKDPFQCEYTPALHDIIKCPHNHRPHDIRRGSITAALRDDIPKVAVSDRMDVSAKTLDRHYNQMSEDERAEKRREYFTDK